MAIFVLRRMLSFLIIHTTLLCAVCAYPKNETTDIQALLEFKSELNDPLQVLKSWNSSVPLCQWYGVTCGSQHRRVQKLYLNSSKLTGTISPYVGNLSFLTELGLQNNSFRGNIPLEIGRLKRLRRLRCANNSLTGRLPSNMSNCYNLIQIHLYNNNLEVEIPIEFGSFPKLVMLVLSRNNFSGQIPSSLGNLSTLQCLDLSSNNVTGVLPYTLGLLNRLTYFNVMKNRLSGSIPPLLYNLSSLEAFVVADNQIHGSLPIDLFNTLPNLHFFSIWNNKMTGDIPNSLSNATNLAVFMTNTNNFIGKLPSLEKLWNLRRFQISYNNHGNGNTNEFDFLCSLTNHTFLVMLSISYNKFGGTLPNCIGNLSSLRHLDIIGNRMIGAIPIKIGNLTNLEVLAIGENQLSGNIPSSIGNLESLRSLYLGGNKLSGNIPCSLGKLTNLTLLLLGNNKLQGMIPEALGGCKSLNELHLNANDLVGAMPLEIFQISSLLELNVAQNHLEGPLPPVVQNLENLNSLDVSENMLSQTIPNSLEKCLNLRELFMQGNFFEGMIPQSLGSLRGIDVIDLSRNNLSGQIPKSLANLMFLENLNLSYNNLEGQVPKDGVFKNFSKFSVIGNKKLCGGISELSLTYCSTDISHKKVSRTIVEVVLSVFGGLLVILSMTSFLLFYWFKKKRNIVSQSSFEDPLLRLSYQSLLRATNGFSSTNMLGTGSFGSVYKAILDTSEMIIAVKLFDLQRHGASKSFLAECEVLKKIRHRNLVKILTACSSIDFSGNEFKALVYEFMANGSLDDWLHPSESTSQTEKHLGFIKRLNIAIDVASALDYLHHHYDTPIIHRDIKPSNVLLDNEMIGHVGDFGLSKFLLDTSNDTNCGQTSSIGFNGTIGYIAPEYGMGTSVSIQGDVYSYGILILEMFTGKRPTDNIFCGSININCFVKAALPDKVAELVDLRLFAEIQELSKARNSIMECLVAIFEIGVSCSAILPIKRKSMKDVVVELQFIRRKILGN